MNRRTFIKFFKPVLFLIGLLTALFTRQTNSQSNSKSTEIIWDKYGVPHIYGVDTKSAFKAFGWAQMNSHGNLILRLYGQARGRAAEYWGEDYLESDRWVVTMGVPKRSKTWYKQQNAKFRRYLDAFAVGINNYAKEHPELIDDEVKFEKVLQRLQLPMFTIMYADREGHIMHLFNGQVPIRSQGDFEYWSDIIPGTL